MHKKIAVLVTYDFEDAEYAEPVEAFRAARHSIINLESQAGKIIYGKKRKAFVTIDQSIDDASVHDFDALLIPGGFSPDNLCQDERYVIFVRHFANTQKPILCSADAPQILMHAEVVKGRRMTCIHHLHQDLKDAGAVLYDTGVVNDNNLYISSQTQYDLPRLYTRKFIGTEPIKKSLLEALLRMFISTPKA